MRNNRNILSKIHRLAAEEDAFLAQTFFTPVVPCLPVQVRIAGIVCSMKVRDAIDDYAVLKPVSHAEAKVIRRATMVERRAYLRLFPQLRLILCHRQQDLWLARPFEGDGLVPVRRVEEADLFDTVVARFDGQLFWFESTDDAADPRAAPYLREQLRRMTEPAQLILRGITLAQRQAYASRHAERLYRSAIGRQARDERRLAGALAHAGATLRDFTAAKDVYRVSFVFDGRRHTSVVRKNDLTVQTAGICLSGLDAQFDLQSLVGVLRGSDVF